MRSTGIRRKVDDLGRVVIPAGIRRSLGIREGDEIEVHVDGEHVILAKPSLRCVFCGTEDEPLQAYRERHVCRSCVASVGVLDETLRERAREAATQPNDTGWQPPAAVVEPARRAPVARDDDRAPDDVAATAPARTAQPAPQPQPQPEPQPERPTDDAREDDDLYDPASTTAW